LSGQDLYTNQAITVKPENKKGMVVVFLSATCPCSNSHIPELIALSKAYPDFEFVAVHSNSNETVESARTYFKKANLPFPILQDDHAKLADRFKALKTPHAFLILPSGETAYQGGVSNSSDFAKASKRFLKDALQDIEDHQNVKVSEGRTLGCAIKRG
jgi:peroxiredoxin